MKYQQMTIRLSLCFFPCDIPLNKQPSSSSASFPTSLLMISKEIELDNMGFKTKPSDDFRAVLYIFTKASSEAEKHINARKKSLCLLHKNTVIMP